MWLRLEWQFAQITAEVSRKFTRPPVAVPEMLSNGKLPVYGVAPPTSLPASEISAGSFVHANVSCTQRTRRNAKLLNKCACMDGFVKMPACVGVPFAQLPGVTWNVVALIVGPVPCVAMNSCWYEPASTVSLAANAGA